MTKQQRSKQGRTNSIAQRVAWQKEAIRCKAMAEERAKEIAKLSAEIVAHINHSAEWRRKCLNEEQAHSLTRCERNTWQDYALQMVKAKIMLQALEKHNANEKAQTLF